jgi:hypothetical protein
LPILLFLAAVVTAEAKPKRNKALEGASFAASDEIIYRGICDASAAVALGTNLVVVATDEENRLRLYPRDRGGPPLGTFDVSLHASLVRGPTETDIEGGARLGNCVYWIGSHSRNQDGKLRPNRARFFATVFEVTGESAKMRFVGQPYENLARDLASAAA